MSRCGKSSEFSASIKEMPTADSLVGGGSYGGNHSGKEWPPAVSSAGVAPCLVTAPTETWLSNRHSDITPLGSMTVVSLFSTSMSSPSFHQ